MIVQTAPADLVDTDDSLAEAVSLGAISTTAKTVDASITPDVDVDMYRFTVTAGQVVDFDIDTTLNGSGGLGSYLRLFDAQGQELAFNNDATAPGETEIGFDAYLRHTFPSRGTFYVGVSNFNNAQYDPITGDGDTAGGRDSIGSYQLIVQDPQVGTPTLTMSISPAAISENGGRATGTVTRSDSDISQLLVVTLDSSDTSEATVSATVTIPANQVSKTFVVTAVDDVLLDGTQTVTITASALGYVGDNHTIDVTDFETLSVTISPTAISENGGTATGTVTRSNTDDSAALVVTLASNDTSEATVPTTITVPAGQASATFAVTAVDDSLGDGTQSVVVTASGSGFTSASAELDVTDDEGGLILSLSGDVLSEHGGTVLGTISRIAADTSQPLVVNVVSSDVTAATVPATVTIPVGQTSAVFTITGVDDAQSDGVQPATITISAPSFQSAAKTVLVADDERPYQNPRNALDVDDDQFVSAKDALIIINILNEIGSGPAAAIMAQHQGAPIFPDTNGDNFISPIDALLVINRLSNPPGGQGEGEAPAVQAATSAAATSPLRAVLVDAVHSQGTAVAGRPSPLVAAGNTRIGVNLGAVLDDLPQVLWSSPTHASAKRMTALDALFADLSFRQDRDKWAREHIQ